MIAIHPVTLQGHGVRLEPLTLEHHDALAIAAADGRLWELWFTSVRGPGETTAYIEEALARQRAGHHLAFAVRDVTTEAIVGTTSYHDVVSAIDRVEIGWTWYAASYQRTHVNTSCKLLLLTHAFETLRCRVVGLRTDNLNVRSQRAIEALGAKKDGVLRHAMRPAVRSSDLTQNAAVTAFGGVNSSVTPPGRGCVSPARGPVAVLHASGRAVATLRESAARQRLLFAPAA
jgi:RimJ/RimL family protein N-acetyltransferase